MRMLNMKDYHDLIVVVTGASSGLGRAIAVGAARRGARGVIVNYASKPDAAEETAEMVRREGAVAVICQGDVGEDAGCTRIAQAAEQFGRVDVLFNNAGTTRFAPDYSNFDALGAQDFLDIYNVNVVGAWRM